MVRHVQVHRASPATRTTTCSPTTWASTTSPASWHQFGLGSRTGIDIDGESTGVLPSQAWKMKRFKQTGTAALVCRRNHLSIGIGQGYNTYTPIQLAQAVPRPWPTTA
jgi:cell division protein FtsI/penicillin-binding protein 2